MVTNYITSNMYIVTIIRKSFKMLSMDNKKVMSRGGGGVTFPNSQIFKKIKNEKVDFMILG